MDYRAVAQQIYDKVGKKENLVSAAHCATRLRLVIADNAKCDAKAIEDIDGVKGVFSASGQLQIILGTGVVNKVYDEFIAISGLTAASKEEVKAAAAAKQPLPQRVVKALGDVFVPILPAIVAAGLMMGLVEALGQFIPSFAQSDIYGWMDLVSNTAIVYLPVLVAISSARVFGGNIFLAGTIGMLLMHMNLLSAWTAASDPAQIKYWHILFFNIRQVNYQGHIIPIIIAIWIMCQLEKRLHKVVPEMIDLFVTPLVTVFVTSFLTMSVIGPVFIIVEDNILTVVKALLTLPLGIGAFVCGAIYPLTVVCGIHHMFNVLEAGMIAENGMNIWLPVSCSANFASCCACVAVFVKAKNMKTKSLALPAGLSASLGITEPAIFGVNLRFVKPLACSMVGAAFGAALGSMIGVYGSAYGVTGFPGFLITTHCTLQYTIMLAVAGGIAFALTYLIWKEEVPQAPATKAPEVAIPSIQCKPGTVYAPVSGTVIPDQEIPDETFAAGVLGRGVGIHPTVGMVVAPFDGEISSVTDTQHAVGITSPDGIELLIHVGVDTVAMNGDGFECLVKEGQQVKAGEKLIVFDRDKIAAANHPDCVVVLVTNADDYENLAIHTGPCKTLDSVITV